MAELKVEAALRWMQDLSNEDRGRVTAGDGKSCPCPLCGCLIYHPLEGVKVKKDDQTMFTKRCVKQHCRKIVQFVVWHESSDIGEKVSLYAAPYHPKRQPRAFASW